MAFVQVSPANPTGTVSGTLVMAGVAVAGATAWTITPNDTGRIFVIVTGIMNDATTAMTCTVGLRFGTGAAPANGAAVTGTAIGSDSVWITLTGQLQQPFSMSGIIPSAAVTGVTPLRQTGTPVPIWLDLGFGVSSANSFTLTNLCCTAFEF